MVSFIYESLGEVFHGPFAASFLYNRKRTADIRDKIKLATRLLLNFPYREIVCVLMLLFFFMSDLLIKLHAGSCAHKGSPKRRQLLSYHPQPSRQSHEPTSHFKCTIDAGHSPSRPGPPPISRVNLDNGPAGHPITRCHLIIP